MASFFCVGRFAEAVSTFVLERLINIPFKTKPAAGLEQRVIKMMADCKLAHIVSSALCPIDTRERVSRLRVVQRDMHGRTIAQISCKKQGGEIGSSVRLVTGSAKPTEPTAALIRTSTNLPVPEIKLSRI
jgi:hypothetical protein